MGEAVWIGGAFHLLLEVGYFGPLHRAALPDEMNVRVP